MSNIEQDVREFLCDNLFLTNGDSLADDESFLEKGIVDSMGILHLIAFVEEKYGIPVEDKDLVTENWDSVRRISDYVRSKIAALEPVTGTREASAVLADCGEQAA
jgi:acyl carrier protein